MELLPGFLPTGRYSNSFYVVNSFMHVLSVTNASVNFFFYYTLGSRYRATLGALCCGHKKRGKSPGLWDSQGNSFNSRTVTVSVVTGAA